MARTIDVIIAAREQMEAAAKSYQHTAVQASTGLNTVAVTSELLKSVADWETEYAKSIGTMLKSISSLPPTPMPLLLTEEALASVRAITSDFLKAYNPIEEMVRSVNETWEQTLRSLTDFRFDWLSGLTEEELFALANQVVADEEASNVELAAPAEQRTPVLDAKGKLGLLSIFIALLVVTGRMPADQGMTLLNLFVALLTLFKENAEGD